MLKITRLAISVKPVNQKEKKGASNSIYLYTFLQILGSKFKIPNVTEAVSTFRHLENRHLMAQQTAQR